MKSPLPDKKPQINSAEWGRGRCGACGVDPAKISILFYWVSFFPFYLLRLLMGTLATTSPLSPHFSSKLSVPSPFHHLPFIRNPSIRTNSRVAMETHLRVSASSTLGACSVFYLLLLNCISVPPAFFCGCLVAEKPGVRGQI